MWMLRRLWCHILLSIFASTVHGITNSNFNTDIREYSLIGQDVANATNIKTLQKDIEKYASYTPANSPVNYKEVPDSALSSTSQSRGLHHEHPGYVISDYEDIPHYSHGYEYHVQEPHGYKYYEHYNDHYGQQLDYGHGHGHGHGYGHGHRHHNKHYEHALAAKTLLWPIAGIALLGAAAALVSNPVLLQLGVVSGRRRRDTNQVPATDNIPDIEKLPEVVRIPEKLKDNDREERLKKIMAKWNAFKEVKHPATKTVVLKSVSYSDNLKTQDQDDYGGRFIPIPIMIKNNK